MLLDWSVCFFNCGEDFVVYNANVANKVIATCKEALQSDNVINELAKNHWYQFYSEAFNQLVATHAALFGGLIAVACAVFALKYWHDNKGYEKELEKKTAKIKEDFDDLETKMRNVILQENFRIRVSICRNFADMGIKNEKFLIPILSELISEASRENLKEILLMELSGQWNDLLDRLIKCKGLKDYEDYCLLLIELLQPVLYEDIIVHLNLDKDKLDELEKRFHDNNKSEV